MNFGWGRAALLAAVLLAAAVRPRRSIRTRARPRRPPSWPGTPRKRASSPCPAGCNTRCAGGTGGGVSPDRNDLVKVDYEGKLVDNTVFDSSFARGAPAVFTPEEVVKAGPRPCRRCGSATNGCSMCRPSWAMASRAIQDSGQFGADLPAEAAGRGQGARRRIGRRNRHGVTAAVSSPLVGRWLGAKRRDGGAVRRIAGACGASTAPPPRFARSPSPLHGEETKSAL